LVCRKYQMTTLMNKVNKKTKMKQKMNSLPARMKSLTE
jgi:hypothetical protein